MVTVFHADYPRPPHLYEGRILQTGQRIHESVFTFLEEHKDSDKCKAKFFHGDRWYFVRDHLSEIRDGKFGGVVVEKGSHADAIYAIKNLKDSSEGGEREFLDDTVSKLWLLVSSGVSPCVLSSSLDQNTDMIDSQSSVVN